MRVDAVYWSSAQNLIRVAKDARDEGEPQIGGVSYSRTTYMLAEVRGGGIVGGGRICFA